MEQLSKDLRYFKQELERENDPFRRNLLLVEIRNVETRIVDLLKERKAQLQRENEIMQAVMDKIDKEAKKWFEILLRQVKVFEQIIFHFSTLVCVIHWLKQILILVGATLSTPF